MVSSVLTQFWFPTIDPSRIHLIQGVEVTNELSCTSTSTNASEVCSSAHRDSFNVL